MPGRIATQGTQRTPRTPRTPSWLAVTVRGERGRANPLLELRLRYDRWRRGEEGGAPGC